MLPDEARFRIGGIFSPLAPKPYSVCLLVFDIGYSRLHAPALKSCTCDGPSAKFADRLSRGIEHHYYSFPTLGFLQLLCALCPFLQNTLS
jgi:hypothetical protein